MRFFLRRLAFYGDLGPSMKQGTTTLASWLVPDPDAALDPADAMLHRGAIAAIAGVLLVVVVVTGVWRARRERVASSAGGSSEGDRPDALRLIAAATLLVACYLGLLVVSRLVADPGIPFDERILAPVIVLATTIAATGLALWWRSTRAELPKVALCGALLGWWCAAASANGPGTRCTRACPPRPRAGWSSRPGSTSGACPQRPGCDDLLQNPDRSRRRGRHAGRCLSRAAL